MAPEDDIDDNLAKQIEDLAFTFRRKGLVANMDEALDKAKQIILATKDKPSFIDSLGPEVEELFGKESAPEEETHYTSSITAPASEPSNQDPVNPPANSYMLPDSGKYQVNAEEEEDSGDDSDNEKKDSDDAYNIGKAAAAQPNPEYSHSGNYSPSIEQCQGSQQNELEIDMDDMKATPLEDLDPEIRTILVEMDQDITVEHSHVAPVQSITHTVTDDEGNFQDFHMLDSYFEEEEGKDLNKLI